MDKIKSLRTYEIAAINLALKKAILFRDKSIGLNSIDKWADNWKHKNISVNKKAVTEIFDKKFSEFLNDLYSDNTINFENYYINPGELKTFKIPVEWVCCGTVEIEAQNLEEALEIFDNTKNNIPLPKESYYLEDSFNRWEKDDEYYTLFNK